MRKPITPFITSCWILANCRFLCSRVSPLPCSLPEPMITAALITPANIPSPARVPANGRATTTGRCTSAGPPALTPATLFPPGTDDNGRPYHARQYSIASPRDGERPGYNNLSLTVKRVTSDYDGNPVRGVASNYLCDLQKGDKVRVIGPFGNTFLMPNLP